MKKYQAKVTRSYGSSNIITIPAKNETDAVETILKIEAVSLWAKVKDEPDLLKFKVRFDERTVMVEFKDGKATVVRVYPPEEVAK